MEDFHGEQRFLHGPVAIQLNKMKQSAGKLQINQGSHGIGYKNKCLNQKEIISMLERIKAIIAEQLNVEESEIKAESRFKEDLGADSLDLFELVMALEDEYSVEIPAEELEKITSVQAVMDYLSEKGVN